MPDGVDAKEPRPTLLNTSAQQDQTIEDWHGWMALGAVGTLVLGIISIVNSASDGAPRALGSRHTAYRRRSGRHRGEQVLDNL